jgi:hypothetical protein
MLKRREEKRMTLGRKQNDQGRNEGVSELSM